MTELTDQELMKWEASMIFWLGLAGLILVVIIVCEYLEYVRGEGKYYGKKPHRPYRWIP